MKVLITGGTGFVGSKLIEKLATQPDMKIYALVRSVDRAKSKITPSQVEFIEWSDIYQTFAINENELDAVINLMGAGIMDKRWNNERKKELYNSRVDGTKNLFQLLEKQNVKVKNIIQMSAIGIYGESSAPINEQGKQVSDFLGKLCQDWEAAMISNATDVPHYSILRTGIVLGKGGGAMDKLLTIFKFGIGGKLASGNQYMSWIHVEDLIRLIERNIMSPNGKKIYNAVSPYPVTNKEFTQLLGNFLNKPTLFPVPKFALKVALGEASVALLANQNISPALLKEEKFIFRYPTLENALKEVVSV